MIEEKPDQLSARLAGLRERFQLRLLLKPYQRAKPKNSSAGEA